MKENGKGLIVLDPGHGEKANAHTTKEGFYEGTQNFILAEFLRKELNDLGYNAISTRKKITDDPTLEERGRLAGDNNAILFMSIHSNAPGTPSNEEEKKRYPTVRGVETYYSVTDKEENAKLAKMLTATVARVMNTQDRGIKIRLYPDKPDVDFYGVIRNSAQSGCKRAILVEHGFHTNPEDSAFLQDSDCLAKLAHEEALTIDKYFSEK